MIDIVSFLFNIFLSGTCNEKWLEKINCRVFAGGWHLEVLLLFSLELIFAQNKLTFCYTNKSG
jgi:hypothetical protein